MPDGPITLQFQTLPADFRDAARLVQSQLNDSITASDERAAALGAEQTRRKNVAITLKVVTVLSGLIIATGFVKDSAAQILGGIIPGIAALERIFANMSRLLAVSAAKNAYEHVRRSVVARHGKQIIDVVKIRDREPERSAEMLIKMSGELRDDLAARRDEIEGRLAQNDYDNLGRLNLDEKVEST